jgi:hypothetical protein
LNERATREEILKNLRAMVDRTRFGKNDRVMVFFSGHGATATMPQGGEMGYWVPYDAEVNPDDPQAYDRFENTCVPMREIWQALRDCPSKHVLVVADACYSGLLAAPRALPDVSENPVAQAHSERRALQIMTAGRRGEKSFERSDLGHGAFTYALLKALDRRSSGQPGNVFTATGLFAAIHDPVTEITRGKQTPTLGRHEDEEGEFLFITTAPQEVSLSDPGWLRLYNGRDLNGWRVAEGPDRWQARGDVLAYPASDNGRALLYTIKEYSDFMLRIDWRVPPGSNGGIILRAPFPITERPYASAMEIQLLDTVDDPEKEPDPLKRAGLTGAIQKESAPLARAARPPGEWNTCLITCRGPRVIVVMNGVEVQNLDLDSMNTSLQGARPLAQRPRQGCIGLQSFDSRAGVEYRNLWIRPLPP